jgi:hypothetical protein
MHISGAYFSSSVITKIFMESRTKAMIFFQFCDLSFNKYKFFPTILKYLLKKSARPKSIFQSILSLLPS